MEVMAVKPNKKSFILYADQYDVIGDLSNLKKGSLFSLIFAYVRGEPLPHNVEADVQMAFGFIKQQIDRDAEKYEKYVEKQRENGKKGGRAPLTQKTQAFSGYPKKADTDTVTVTDINTPQPPKSESEHFTAFWEAYPPTRKTDKAKCLRAWASRKLDSQATAIMRGLEAWKTSNDWRKDGGQFVPAPYTWLNNSRWETPPGAPPPPAKQDPWGPNYNPLAIGGGW